MKSKDLQNIVLSKYDTLTEIHRHLNDGISLARIERYCQMIRQSASRDTCCSTDSHDTKENIQKVINRLRHKQQASAGRLSRERLQQVSDEYYKSIKSSNPIKR